MTLKKSFTFFFSIHLGNSFFDSICLLKNHRMWQICKNSTHRPNTPPSTVAAQQIAGLPTWFRHRTIGPVPKRKASVDRRTPEKDAAGSGCWADFTSRNQTKDGLYKICNTYFDYFVGAETEETCSFPLLEDQVVCCWWKSMDIRHGMVKKNTGQFIRSIGHGTFCTSTAGMDNWYFMGTRSISLVMKCSFLRPTKNSWTKNTVFQLDYFTVPLPSIVNRLLYLKFTKRFQSYKCRSIIIPKKKILVILWVPKNRRRSAPTRIFFHGTHRFTPIRHRHRSPRDPVARVPPGTWTRDREDAIWPKFGGRRKPNSLPTSWRFLEKTCEQVGGKISTNYCSVIENFWGQALIIIQDSTVNLFRNDIWNDP